MGPLPQAQRRRLVMMHAWRLQRVIIMSISQEATAIFGHQAIAQPTLVLVLLRIFSPKVCATLRWVNQPKKAPATAD